MVQGQKLIQNTADVLLGCSSFMAEDGRPRDYYVRQLWNGKGSIDTDEFDQAIASFAVSYAEQNDEDYAVFKKLLKSGDLPC